MMNLTNEPTEHTPLNREPWVIRNGFSHWAVAIIWIVMAFILFQITAAMVAVALMAITSPGEDVMEMMSSRMDLLFIGNSVGQILFLALATWLVAKLHVEGNERASFLRLKLPEGTTGMVGLTALLFVVVQPAIWYIGYLNSLLPMPDYFEGLQETQYEMIESFLRTDGILLMGLINIALVPAICEEVMFRGYVQRAFETSWGIWPAILISGLLFGLFHVQLTNLLPLASLGILLALVTWLSGSLLPAIVAHFINNGGAVFLASYYPDMAFAELSPETAPPVWALLISIVLSAMVIRQLFINSKST